MPPKNQQQPKPVNRLVIRDIEVENFKSYAGKHCIGPFHKTFTTVIGPNGSGKSNVIDSMLFVFGKSARKIRVEGKLSDLIHNSAAHPNVPSASVTVNFVEIVDEANDPNQRIEVPNTQLSITRRVTRSGQSGYYIDGKSAPQKEVVELLKSKGVDLDHNRFLILQGEVEQIAMMKPRAEKDGEEGLVEYFDDLIGTNTLIERINEASRLAAEAYENRLDILTKLADAEKQRDKMSDAKDECISYVTQHNELQRLVSTTVQIAAMGIREEMKAKVDELQGVMAQREHHEQRAKTHEEEMARLNNLAKEAAKEREKTEREAQQLIDERAKLEDEFIEKKTQQDTYEKNRKKTAEALKKKKEEFQRNKQDLENAGRDKAIFEQRKNEARNFIDEHSDEFDRQQDEIEQRIIPLRKEEAKLVGQIAPYQRAVTAAEQDFETAKAKLQALKQSGQQREQEILGLRNKIEQGSSHLERIKNQLDVSDNSRGNLEERLQEAQTEREQFAREKAQIGAHIENRKNEVKAGASDDKVTSFLSSQPELKGYYGPLRALGSIDDRYDIAAGVTGQGAWSFHVVDSPETGEQAMTLLKSNNVGRATFIPLSKVSRDVGQRLAAQFNAPRGSVRLFDLIQPTDAKFRPAFYFVCRDTLVAESLTRARELGLAKSGDRFKCVTVEGDLVDPAGTITGGGKNAPRGADLRGTGQSTSGAKKAEIIAQLKQLQEQLMGAHQQEQEAQNKINQIQMKMREVILQPGQYQTMKRQLVPLMAAIEADKQRLETLEREQQAESGNARASGNGSLDAQMTACQHDIEIAYENLEKRKNELDIKKHDLTETRSQIQNAAGVEFGQFKDQMESMKKQLREADDKLSNFKRNESKIEAQVSRLENDIARLEASLAEAATEEVQQIREDMQQLGEEIKALDGKLRNFKAVVADIDERIEELKKKHQAENEKRAFENTKIQECQRQENEIRDQLKPAMAKVAALSNKKQECEREIIDNIQKYGIQTWKVREARQMATEDDREREYEEEALGGFNAGGGRKSSSKKNKKSKKTKIKKEKNSDDDESDSSSSSSSDDEDDDEEEQTPSQSQQQQQQQFHHADPNNSGDKVFMLRQSQQELFPLSQDGAATFPMSPSERMIRNARATGDKGAFRPEQFTTSLPPSILKTFSMENLKTLARDLNTELETKKAKINFEAVSQWLNLSEIYDKVKAEHDQIVADYNQYHGEEERLKEERKIKFLKTFGIIQHKLKEVYQTITRSGDAELELVDSSDPFEGIRFTVRPPRKAWKAIGNLSGGEKTLSSLALVFALHHIRPTPVYVLDEIDAALDFRNVAIVGKYILEKGIGAQFIIISLRNNMFELAHQIVGISKVSDCTRSIVISPKFLSDRIAEAAHQGLSNMMANRNNNHNRSQKPITTTASSNNNNRVSSGGENVVPRSSNGSDKRHRAEEDEE